MIDIFKNPVRNKSASDLEDYLRNSNPKEIKKYRRKIEKRVSQLLKSVNKDMSFQQKEMEKNLIGSKNDKQLNKIVTENFELRCKDLNTLIFLKSAISILDFSTSKPNKNPSKKTIRIQSEIKKLERTTVGLLEADLEFIEQHEFSLSVKTATTTTHCLKKALQVDPKKGRSLIKRARELLKLEKERLKSYVGSEAGKKSLEKAIKKEEREIEKTERLLLPGVDTMIASLKQAVTCFKSLPEFEKYLTYKADAECDRGWLPRDVPAVIDARFDKVFELEHYTIEVNSKGEKYRVYVDPKEVLKKAKRLLPLFSQAFKHFKQRETLSTESLKKVRKELLPAIKAHEKLESVIKEYEAALKLSKKS